MICSRKLVRRRRRLAGHQSPAALRPRRVVDDAGPAEGPTIPPQEIVRHAGFIEKNRIPGRRGGVPHDPRGRDVRSIVFGGPDRFFLTVTSRAATARQIRQTAGVPSASFSAAKVRSGCSAISRVCRCGSNIRRRPCPGRAARLRPSPADAASTAAPTTRSRGTAPDVRGLHPGITSSRARSEIHPRRSVLLHWCIQKYHDEPKQSRA